MRKNIFTQLLRMVDVDGGRIEYVRLFTLVAIFILLIACINFMNLATAQSARRAKEVGLRKVIGAARFSLIKQFIGEAMMLTFFSMIIALTLTELLLPAFNSLTGKQLSLPFTEPVFWISLTGLFISYRFYCRKLSCTFPVFIKANKSFKRQFEI
jgi:ABC-type antimicrobial peptide transport system permease subunit